VTDQVLTTPKLDRRKPLNVVVEESRGDTVEITWVYIRDLVSDSTYQRDLEPTKVYRIATNFDPDSFGTLVISKRTDGTLAIIDGGHRVAAMYDIGWEDQKVPAVIHTGLSVRDEARVFTTLNSNRTKPKPVDIHRASVAAGNPDAVAIQSVLDKHNVKVVKFHKSPGLRSIGTVYRLYQNGGVELVDGVLDVLLRAYDGDRHTDTFFYALLTSVGAILYSDSTVNRGRLAKAVASIGTPQQVFARGSSIAAVSGTKPINETANQLIMAYNKGLRTNRIDVVTPTGHLFPKRK